jgi:hypothetical protein
VPDNSSLRIRLRTRCSVASSIRSAWGLVSLCQFVF